VSLVEGFRAGGVDYIIKPFEKEELLIRVENHLKISRLTNELIQKNRELEQEIARREQAEDARKKSDEQLSLISEQEAKRWGIVGDMPLELQPKLLRVIEDGSVLPVGGSQEKRVDVRIIAATNQNLSKEMAEGAFREDLFFRLERFVGAAWTNEPEAEMAPPATQSHSAWAFVVSGSVGARDSSYTVTVKNLRTGAVATGNSTT